MQTEPLAPRDEKLFRDGLTGAQTAIFDEWRLYVEKWVEQRSPFKRGRKVYPGPVSYKQRIADFQGGMCEALLALRRTAASYDGVGVFKPLLDAALHNAMEDMRLREKRRREVSIDLVQSAIDLEDGQHVGFDMEETILTESKRGKPGGVVRVSRRSRHWSVNRLSPVLVEVVRREAQQAYERGHAVGWKWGFRRAMEICGRSDDEIDLALAEEEDRLWREDRNRQQRARRHRQRMASA